tara:strand:+ start:283 stop:597 length:315 start_codon:yes stop_codon:yes gene_type:complete
MLNKKLKDASNSKLTSALIQLSDPLETKKTGFIIDTKKLPLKTKSFKLREEDLVNYNNIISYINNNNDRMKFSDSQIIRGLINYFANNMDKDFKKVMASIKISC